jgi:sporulation integral membrane protein YtvI
MSQTGKKFLFSLLLALCLFLPPVRKCAAAGGIGLLCAGICARPIAWLEGQGAPRWLGTLFVLGGALTLLGAGVVLSAARLFQGLEEMTGLFSDFPSLFQRLITLAGKIPGAAGTLLAGLLEQLSQQSSVFSEHLAEELASSGTKFLSALPEKLFFLFIAVLLGFYAAADWEGLKKQLLSLVPEDWSKAVRSGLHSLREGALGWLKAQGKLMLLQFGLLSAGLLVLRVRGAVLAGALVAVADALPLFGSGIILVPWAGILWLTGKAGQGLGMLLLWLGSWLLRTILEPKMVGNQAGSTPFFTLLSMYLGLLLVGFWGLIAAPMILAAGMRLRKNIKKNVPLSESQNSFQKSVKKK